MAGAAEVLPFEVVTVCAWCVPPGTMWPAEVQARVDGGAKVSHGICARHRLELEAERAGMDWRRK